MLRARKILAYVAEKLEALSTTPPGTANSPTTHPASSSTTIASGISSTTNSSSGDDAEAALKPEDWLELYCQNQVVPLKMTLATMRTQIWKGGSDVALFYRMNGKRKLTFEVTAQAGAGVQEVGKVESGNGNGVVRVR